MKQLMNYLSQKRCLIVLIILFVINSAFFFVPISPLSTIKITRNAPDIQIPDMIPFYSTEYIYTFLENIGEKGRQLYQLVHLTSDLAFPLIYGLLFFGLISRFSLILDTSSKMYTPFLPWGAAIFDLAENFTLNYITSQFPERLMELARLAQIFTLMKAIFLFTTIAYSAYLGFQIILRRYTALENYR